MTEVRHVRRRRGQTRITAKNQATLPVDALRAAGLEAGDVVRVAADGAGRIVLERVDDPIRKWAGAFDDLWPEGYLEELRNEWR